MSTLVKVIIAVVVLAGISVALGAWYTHGSKDSMEFKTSTLKRGDLVATISATGTVEPEESVDVGAQVAGQISSFGKDTEGKTVDYRSEIAAGTVLAKIDDSLYQADVVSSTASLAAAKASVQRAQADLLQMKAKLVQAQRDWDRAQKLGPSDALAQSSYDAYEAGFESAKANVAVSEAAIIQAQGEVAQADAALQRAQRNLSYCTISSPVKGTIIDRRVNIGQTVVSSLNAPSLFLIAKDLGKVQVWASVNEADIGNIRAGQDVTFTCDAFPNRTFKGNVGKVRLNATMTQNVVTYTVEINADNADLTLIPYLTANVSFNVAKHENVFLVPNPALRWSPSDGEQVSPDARSEFGNPGKGGGKAASADASPTSRPAKQRNGPTTDSTARAASATKTRGMIWVEDGTFVKPIHVRIGMTDGINTEVTATELKEGQEIVIGEGAPASASSDDARNPFAPKFGSRRGR